MRKKAREEHGRTTKPDNKKKRKHHLPTYLPTTLHACIQSIQPVNGVHLCCRIAVRLSPDRRGGEGGSDHGKRYLDELGVAWKARACAGNCAGELCPRVRIKKHLASSPLLHPFQLCTATNRLPMHSLGVRRDRLCIKSEFQHGGLASRVRASYRDYY